MGEPFQVQQVGVDDGVGRLAALAGAVDSFEGVSEEDSDRVRVGGDEVPDRGLYRVERIRLHARFRRVFDEGF